MEMQNNLEISIPKPCHENWANMTQNERGRHCAVCNKTVTDFSKCSDEELLNFFKDYKGGTCGRFALAQVNRPLQAAPVWRSVAAGLLLAGTLVTATSCDKEEPTDTPTTCEPGDRYITGDTLFLPGLEKANTALENEVIQSQKE